MARAITIKEEWLNALSGLSERNRNEAVGAIYIFLLTGNKTEVSNKVSSVLSVLWPFIEKSRDRSDIYRKNVEHRYINSSRNSRQIVDTIVATNQPTIVDTNALQNAVEKEDFSSPLPLSLEERGHIDNNNSHVDIINSHVDTEPKQSNTLAKERKAVKAFDLSFVQDESFREVVRDWLEYKQNKGQKYKDEKSLKTMVRRLESLSGADPGVARQIIDEAISNNYTGFFALKDNKTNGNTTNNRQHIGGRLGADYTPDYSIETL